MTAERSPLRMAAPSVLREDRADGSILLRSGISMPDVPRQFGLHLRRWAEQAPQQVLFAERGTDGQWMRLSYEQAALQADSVSQALLERGHTRERPIACLSDKSLHMAVLKLGAMQVGIPFLPVSTAYSLLSSDFARLRYVMQELRPTLVYVDSVRPYLRALKALDLAGVQVVCSEGADEWPGAIPFGEFLQARPTPRVQQAFEQTGPDDIAKLLLTSGSTGMPKAVINTHGTICTNGAAVDVLWPFLGDSRHVVLDWLPWNHTFGSNTTFNQTLRHGGTIYMDAGRPTPDKFGITLANMREVRPTLIYNVPRALDMLVLQMEQDDSLAQAVFERLEMVFYAGAALPSSLWHRIDALSVRHRGHPTPILSSLGSTETGPVATIVHWMSREPAGVGLPIPGTTVKLVPNAGKLELRVKGPSISPGYFNRPDLTAAAFDDEGYFMIGDAVRFVDPQRAEAGLCYDGRISENFKLSTGAWVQVGGLRMDMINTCVPLVQDMVVAGHDRDELGLLVFLNLEGCRRVCGEPDLSLAQAAQSPAVRQSIRSCIDAHNRRESGSTRRIARVLLLDDAPCVDANEITDKGYLNQRAILERRAGQVARLFAKAPDPGVLVLDASAPVAGPLQTV